MSHLKKENVNKCFSLLREYIDEAALAGKRETAVLALDQLRRITGGGDSDNGPGCHGWPTAAPSATGDDNGPGCHGRPTAVPIPIGG